MYILAVSCRLSVPSVPTWISDTFYLNIHYNYCYNLPDVLFYSILFYFILFYFILFYFILFYFILFYFILFYFISRLCCFDMHTYTTFKWGTSSRSSCELCLVINCIKVSIFVSRLLSCSLTLLLISCSSFYVF